MWRILVIRRQGRNVTLGTDYRRWEEAKQRCERFERFNTDDDILLYVPYDPKAWQNKTGPLIYLATVYRCERRRP